jgi:hypothetical protein
VVAAFLDSWWWLTALPFIYLGSICAQPNLNLADGCLAYVAMLVGFGTVLWFKPLGLAIAAGAMAGFYLSAIEKRVRMRPVPDADLSSTRKGGVVTAPGNSQGRTTGSGELDSRSKS